MPKAATVVGFVSLPFTAIFAIIAVLIPLSDWLATGSVSSSGALFVYSLIAAVCLAVTIASFWMGKSAKKRDAKQAA